MEISSAMDAVNSTRMGTAPKSSDATGSSKMGKDEFVKLLMAQLSQQDPTSPMDSQAFVAQLAQFASLEQQQTTNASLEALLIAAAANNQSSITNLVGKDVMFKPDKVELSAGQSVEIEGQLKQKAATVTATVLDSNGKVVRTISLGNQEAGNVKIQWDGRDDAGNALPSGQYSIKIAASDVEGKNIPIEHRARGRITGVSFEKGYPELMVGSLRMPMSNVIEIREPETTPPAPPTTTTP